MGTSNSSKETQLRAKQLAGDIGSYHINLNMDSVVKAFATLFVSLFDRRLKHRSEGGSEQENLALKNLQARIRMVLSVSVPTISTKQPL